MVYGLLDTDKIDIDQYKTLSNKLISPVKRYEAEEIFDKLESKLKELYESGGAFIDDYPDSLAIDTIF